MVHVRDSLEPGGTMERNCVAVPTAQALGADDPKGAVFGDNKSPILPGPWGLGGSGGFSPSQTFSDISPPKKPHRAMARETDHSGPSP